MATQTALKITPTDEGRAMSLDDFDRAEARDGYLYELGRGTIVVRDVPGRRHLFQVEATRDQLTAHKLSQPGQIRFILGGSECKLLIRRFESERHPDLAVYLTAPPDDDADMWAVWVPALVIEVVSLGSELRDYVEKREEYLAFGVLEYWIVDAEKEAVTVLRRIGGVWRDLIIKAGETYKSQALPGFTFDPAPVFATARAVSA